MAENQNIRFMCNNLASLAVNSISFSSELPGFPGLNCFNNFRSSLWKTSGQFQITLGDNDTLYINDGSNKTAVIAAGSYTTAALLCTAIETALNAVSSNWSCDYDISGGTYKFTLSNTSPVILRFSQTAAAVWDTLGYTSALDSSSAMSFEANEQRNHTNEFITIDFGYLTPVQFVGVVSDVSQSFGLSSTAVVTLEGNNINDFTNPPFSTTLEVTSQGIFQFNVQEPMVSHRFYRLNIVDKFNSVQGPFLEFGNIYLGDFQTLEGRTVTSDFTDSLSDPSLRSESESGVLFFDKRTKFTRFAQVPIRLLGNTDRLTLKDIFANVGTTEPFYVALDPLNRMEGDANEYTKYVLFETEPVFTSVSSVYFNTTLNLREVV